MISTIPVTYEAPERGTSPAWCYAFSTGCNGNRLMSRRLMPGHVAMWGSSQLWPMLMQAFGEGRDVYYGDHAYFGRQQYYRVTRNAFMHDGRGDAGPERFQRFDIPIKPWRKTGRHIVLCPPEFDHAALWGFDAGSWLKGALHTLRKHTDRPIRIRYKPRIKPVISLQENLKDCWALVTWRSNTAVEALFDGIPVFCLGDCSASTMNAGDISQIETPLLRDGREQFMWNLAANQWTFQEITRGDCWRAIGRSDDRI